MELVENRNNMQKKMYYYVDIELIYEALIISIRRESLDGVRRKMDTENICDEVLSSDDKTKKKRSRRNMPFATMPASECTIVPESIWKYAAGQNIRRLTLFDQMGKAPESGPSRTLITAASKYGFIKGSTQSEYIELTENGYIAFNPEENEKRRIKAKFEMIIQGNEFFNGLYEKYKNLKLPVKSVLIDSLGELGLDEVYREEGAELFVENARYIGIIKLLSGAERIVPIEQLIEETEGTNIIEGKDSTDRDGSIQVSGTSEWNKICFFIAPIGSDGSEERKHSDLFLESIVAPAIEKFGFEVVRADNISKAGMITSQIIDYIVNAGLVICDLSFHNPNVFYELSLRHSTKKPTVHIIRKKDGIPFDINDFRTIVIDDSDIYTLIPAIESYKTQITQQVRQMLDDPESIDNPILSYLEKNKIKHF